MKRAILIVLDSLGVGELPDAEKYGDKGSNTLGNIYKTIGDLNMGELEKLGIGNIDGVCGPKKCDSVIGCYGKAMELSKGKDTVTGHWEIAGTILDKPLNTYPNGFSKEIIDAHNGSIQVESTVGKGTKFIIII